jgi:hypothetical protein
MVNLLVATYQHRNWHTSNVFYLLRSMIVNFNLYLIQIRDPFGWFRWICHCGQMTAPFSLIVREFFLKDCFCPILRTFTIDQILMKRWCLSFLIVYQMMILFTFLDDFHWWILTYYQKRKGCLIYSNDSHQNYSWCHSYLPLEFDRNETSAFY